MSKFKVGDTIPVSAILTITGVQPTKNGSARYNTDHAINLSEAILDQITIKGKPATVKAVEPQYWSGKVVCVKSDSGVFTAGRSYDFANGAIAKSDSGLPYGAESICGPFKTLEDFNRWSKFAQFIEYKGEA